MGRRFQAGERVWSASVNFEADGPNVTNLADEVESLVAAARTRLLAGAAAGDADRELYADAASYALYYRCHVGLLDLIARERDGEPTPVPASLWRGFRDSFRALLEPGGVRVGPHDAAHLFAVFFQTRRAFVQVFDRLIGGSAAAAALRADVWQSVFTHDRRRHACHLTGADARHRHPRHRRERHRQGDRRRRDRPLAVPTVRREVVELRPAGPVRPAKPRGDADGADRERAVRPQARQLHTGASSDRRGWLEQADRHGGVFLDEVGETEVDVQVKLLRVLQERTFTRVGETRQRRFEGKVIAATNRDLPAEMEAGRFRSDLYYRLSGDLIRTPPLREQIAGDDAELVRLLTFAAGRVVGPEAAAEVAAEARACVARDLGDGYPWPGNFRELEQCVRNVVVRRCYVPPTAAKKVGGDAFATDPIAAAFAGASMTADALLDAYAARVYDVAGSYGAAARVLGIDRRTVKARVERAADERAACRPPRHG